METVVDWVVVDVLHVVVETDAAVGWGVEGTAEGGTVGAVGDGVVEEAFDWVGVGAGDAGFEGVPIGGEVEFAEGAAGGDPALGVVELVGGCDVLGGEGGEAGEVDGGCAGEEAGEGGVVLPGELEEVWVVGLELVEDVGGDGGGEEPSGGVSGLYGVQDRGRTRTPAAARSSAAAAGPLRSPSASSASSYAASSPRRSSNRQQP